MSLWMPNSYVVFIGLQQFHARPKLQIFLTIVEDIILLTPHLYRDRGGNVLVQDWGDGTEVDGLTLLSPYHLVLTDQSIGEGNVNGG